MISPNLAHLTRCIAGQIKRNFGSKDILKLVVNKIWCNTIKFLAARCQIFIPSRNKQTSRHNKVCQIWKFHRKCHQHNGNPVMLGHDDDETRHVSYDRRNSPICELTANTLFALLLVLHWVFYKVYVFLDTNFFSGHATLMWSVA